MLHYLAPVGIRASPSYALNRIVDSARADLGPFFSLHLNARDWG
jgi:hypothetical protein